MKYIIFAGTESIIGGDKQSESSHDHMRTGLKDETGTTIFEQYIGPFLSRFSLGIVCLVVHLSLLSAGYGIEKLSDKEFLESLSLNNLFTFIVVRYEF